MHSFVFVVSALQSQSRSWLDQVLQFLYQLQWPEWEDFRNWVEIHPDAVILAGVLLGLICLVLGLGWWVGRRRAPLAIQPFVEPKVSVLPDFEKQLGVSREDLAEVGLPLLTPEREEADLPVRALRMTSLEALSTEHLMVVARYCVWKGDAESAREVIALVMTRGDAQQRHAALALLEGR
ncbi:MAG: hypothetical protein KGK17_05495 [Betaproteobacteria bacterium]|nr:hypothetical protein [Betaproteobacteria bacterium]